MAPSVLAAAAAGRQAALEGKPREIPYDGRSREAKVWGQAYDAAQEELAATAADAPAEAGDQASAGEKESASDPAEPGESPAGEDVEPSPALVEEEEAMPSRRDEIYVARESGACQVAGETHTFTKGVTRVRAGHPLLGAVPEYFEPMDRSVHYEVETATSGPGEKRGEL